MSVELNLATVLTLVLISQGLFSSFILFYKIENRAANRYLAVLSLFLSLWLLDAFFRVSGIYSQNPNYYFLPIYFSFAFGPLIFFYTKRITGKLGGFRPIDALHFLPVALQFLFYLFLQFQDYAYRRMFWFEIHQPYTFDVELVISFVSLITYLLLSRRLIVEYKVDIENSFSNLRSITLKWLNQLHFLLTILSIIWLLEALGRLVWHFYPLTPFSSISIGILLLVISVGGILQKDLLAVGMFIHKKRMDDSVKTKDPIFDSTQVEHIQKMMTEKELFLEQELTLNEFAKGVGLGSREVSECINKGLGLSFIDFVNHNRIARFKELAKGEKASYMNLLGLAFESGFNSKSTFNRVFKKHEGISPSTFVKRSQNSN